MEATRILKSTVAVLATMGIARPASAQVCVDAPESVLGWWSGDETAKDVAEGRDAKLIVQVDFAPGWVDGAFRLDGVSGAQDARIVMPRSAADGLANLTVELWVNTTDTVGGLFSAANGNSPGGNELLLFQGTSGIDVWVKQQNSATVPVFVSDGAWHHVAFVRDGSSGQLYVDAVLVDTQTYPVGPLDVGPLGLMLGQDQDCLGGCFLAPQALDGLLDEVTAYGRSPL